MDADGEMYEIGTKVGREILKYSRNHFVICEDTFSLEEFPDFILSLRDRNRQSDMIKELRDVNARENTFQQNIAASRMFYFVTKWNDGLTCSNK